VEKVRFEIALRDQRGYSHLMVYLSLFPICIAIYNLIKSLVCTIYSMKLMFRWGWPTK
jgi:hypothetical protein